MKSGWRTSEFWVSLLTSLGGIGASVGGFLPSNVGAIVATVSSVAYAISRGLTKQAQ